MTKILIYAAILAALIGGVVWYGSMRYDAGRNDLIAEQVKQADDARRAADVKTAAADSGGADAIHAGEVKQAESTAKTNTVVQTVTRYIHDSPSPAVCVMPSDDPVLRELTAGTERANAAARAVQGTDASGAVTDASR